MELMNLLGYMRGLQSQNVLMFRSYFCARINSWCLTRNESMFTKHFLTANDLTIWPSAMSFYLTKGAPLPPRPKHKKCTAQISAM